MSASTAPYPRAADLCRQFQLPARKGFGQNFLDDPDILRSMLTPFAFPAGACAVEIGPGLGHLSQIILEAGLDLTAIEIDQRLRPVLELLTQEYPNFHVIFADACELDWRTLYPGATRPLYFFGNLPYYLSTTLFVKALLALGDAQGMTFLLQREVAEKFAAAPGSKIYGPAACLARFYGSVSLGKIVRAGAFFPPPKIDSRILYLHRQPIDESSYEERCAFFDFLTEVFQLRRKTLYNNLKRSKYGKIEVLEVLKREGCVDLTRRPESFTALELWQLFSWFRDKLPGESEEDR